VKCELCGTETTRFVKVNHPERGIIRICGECYREEQGRLLPLPEERGGGCCGR
jgi:ribosome-binding protein aMBF1 (putative translation factor)